MFKGDENSDIWKAYVDYVDESTVDGFFNIIHCSLQYMLDNTDVSKVSQDVLFEAKLELQVIASYILDNRGCFTEFYCDPKKNKLVKFWYDANAKKFTE